MPSVTTFLSRQGGRGVSFDWDPAKNRGNLRKHGLSFETARQVFDDPFALSAFDGITEGEERWRMLGLTETAEALVVVYSFREDGHGEETIRIISARRASPGERRRYRQARGRGGGGG